MFISALPIHLSYCLVSCYMLTARFSSIDPTLMLFISLNSRPSVLNPLRLTDHFVNFVLVRGRGPPPRLAENNFSNLPTKISEWPENCLPIPPKWKISRKLSSASLHLSFPNDLFILNYTKTGIPAAHMKKSKYFQILLAGRRGPPVSGLYWHYTIIIQKCIIIIIIILLLLLLLLLLWTRLQHRRRSHRANKHQCLLALFFQSIGLHLDVLTPARFTF